MLVHDNRFVDVDGDTQASQEHVCVIYVNQPLVPTYQLFWNAASVRMFADGAANRFYDSLQENRENFIPDIIAGDLDSARPEVVDYYKSKGACIIRVHDQDTNDLEKCLQVMSSRGMSRAESTIVVVGAIGGRLDHDFANINMLYKARHDYAPFKRIVLVSNESLAFMLEPGSHIIHKSQLELNKGCALVPVGGECKSITTSGLRWNLDNSTLRFGGLVSTSNEFLSDTVSVTTSDPILWISALPETIL
eukprot:GILK01012755.1.p1 GENE.GILK01012755.1~~GILK01012755.1.p1  ORF type:complete len:249 (+),score=29.53 GILK01012755.1:84-830(+)